MRIEQMTGLMLKPTNIVRETAMAAAMRQALATRLVAEDRTDLLLAEKRQEALKH